MLRLNGQLKHHVQCSRDRRVQARATRAISPVPTAAMHQQTHLTGDVSRKTRKAIAQVLDEGMVSGEEVGRARLLEATHWAEALLEVPVIPLDSIIQVARTPMIDVRQDPAERRWIALRHAQGASGRHRDGAHVRLLDCSVKEGVCCRCISLRAEVRINHLSSVIDCPIDVGPFPVEPRVRSHRHATFGRSYGGVPVRHVETAVGNAGPSGTWCSD